MKMVTVVGGNLYQVAAEQLGSALQWINIAKLNHLVDPVLSGQTRLLIPPFSSAFSDGIGPQ